MKRAFIPGAVDRFGVARPFPGCGGSCNQGRTACDCELSCAVAPDADRVIQPPIRTPEDDQYIARVRRANWALIVAGFSLLAALLEAFGASPFERLNP